MLDSFSIELEIITQSQKTINLKPIGFVTTDASEQEIKNKENTSQIILTKKLTKSLHGISEFSHIFVLFWMGRITQQQRKTAKVHPRGKKDMPLLGIFATRTMLRPNPIGLTIVELIEVKDNVLRVKGLDALNGTPVLDIKPYDKWDQVKKVMVPNWWLKLEKERPK